MFGSRAATLVLGLAIQSCLAWFLGPAGRGSYAVCLMYATMLSVACTFGIDGATQYHVASKRVSLSEGVSVLLSLEFVGAAVGILLGLLVMRLPLAFFDKASDSLFLLAVITVPFQIWSMSLPLILAATREFPFQATALAIQAVLRLSGIVLLVRVIPLGIGGAVAANLLSFALTACIMLVFLRRRHGLHWVRPSWNRIRRFLGYGGRYYFAAFSTLVNFQIGTIMLAFFASESEIGLFHAGATLIVYVVAISDTVGGVLHPRIASDPSGRPELAAQASRVVGLVCGLITLGVLVFAEPIVSVFLSPKFLPAVGLIWILAPGIIVRAGTKILVQYMNATDRPGVFSVSTATSVLVNVTLLLILLPRVGLPGAAWAMSVAYICGGIVLVVSFRKFSGLSFSRSWLPRKTDLSFLVDVVRRVWRRTARVRE